jgi:hypothetical protein
VEKKSAAGRAPKFDEKTLLGDLKIARRSLACTPIRLNLEGDLLALNQTTKACALKCAHMDKHVLAAVVGLNEAIALLTIVPFHHTHIHGEVLSLEMLTAPPKAEQRLSMFGEK